MQGSSSIQQEVLMHHKTGPPILFLALLATMILITPITRAKNIGVTGSTAQMLSTSSLNGIDVCGTTSTLAMTTDSPVAVQFLWRSSCEVLPWTEALPPTSVTSEGYILAMFLGYIHRPRASEWPAYAMTVVNAPVAVKEVNALRFYN